MVRGEMAAASRTPGMTALERRHADRADVDLADLCAADPDRGERMAVEGTSP
ncbi:MAG: hypothetical protein ACRDL1_00560 [Solirubrobacterales bacterium]